MDRLYYDGDSFSCFGVERTTGHVLAEQFGVQLDHYGFRQKTYQQVIRSVMRYTFENLGSSFLCIGIGVPARLDCYSDEKKYLGLYDYSYWEEERNTSVISAYEPETHGNSRVFLDQTHDPYIRTKVLFDLVLLHDYLIKNNFKFIIHNLYINYTFKNNDNFARSIIREIINRPRIVNFFENSLHDIMHDKNIKGWDYKEYGYLAHPDENGHQVYADFLTPYIEKYMNI